MISIELDDASRAHVESVLQRFMDTGKLSTAIKQASRRAAITARKAGAQEIRNTYTMKAGAIKSATSLSTEVWGTTLHIRGPEEPVTKYKASRRKKVFSCPSKKAAAPSYPGHLICQAVDSLPVKGNHAILLLGYLGRLFRSCTAIQPLYPG